MAKLTDKDIRHVAELAQLTLSAAEINTLKPQLSEIIDYVEQLNEVDTTNTEPTSQTTGLFNTFREDVVDPIRMLSQELAVSQTPRSHNGYFVVDMILKNKNE